ncbi:integrase, catalytic region, zinc finger, CCHC-type containing protein [Tanacetum coccineum]
MNGDRSQLTNFVNKFLGTIKFGNDHVAKILGYGDYQIGNVTISRVYYISRQRSIYSVSLEMMASSPLMSFVKATKTKSWLMAPMVVHLNFGAINHLARHGLVRDNGTEFVNQTLREYYEKVSISHETSVARSLQQNSVVERRNRTLIEAVRTMLIYAKALLFLWAKAMATASTAMASEHSSSGTVLHDMDSATISLWDSCQTLLFNTVSPEVVALIDEVAALVSAVSTGSPSSTTFNQDAPSLSNSQTTPDTQPPVIPNNVEEDNHDIEVARIGNDSYFGIPIPEAHSDQSSSSDSIHTIQALFCLLKYDAFPTAVGTQTYKDALTQSSGSIACKRTNETRRSRRYTKEQSLISSSWLPSRARELILKSLLLGCKISGYKDFLVFDALHENGRSKWMLRLRFAGMLEESGPPPPSLNIPT